MNPRQGRDFARALGKLAKTDPLDARVLARFGEATKPQPRPLPDAQAQELQELLARRRQLVETLTAEKNRLATAVQQVRPQLQEHMEWLLRQLERLNQDLETLIRSSLVWRAKEQSLRSVPEVGSVLCGTLLGPQLPELGSLDRRQMVALRGWPPQPRQRHCVGRTQLGAGRPPWGAGSQPVQSDDPGFPPTPSGIWETQEGSPHGLYVQAADHSQCNAQA